MLIDDDEIILRINSLMISGSQIADHVLTFQSATLALDHLQNNQQDWPQVIMCDIDMTIMNGWQFLDKFEALSDQTQNTSMVCIHSASVGRDNFNQACDRESVSLFIPKPLKLNSLITLCKIYLENTSDQKKALNRVYSLVPMSHGS